MPPVISDKPADQALSNLFATAVGVPLVIRVTGANRNDSQEALALVDTVPTLQGWRGRRRRPDCVLVDRGYDAEVIRQGLRLASGRGSRSETPTMVAVWAGIAGQ